jgi:hypothetical protein
MAFLIYAVLIANYPKLIYGINHLIYELSVQSTYLSGGEDDETSSIKEFSETVRLKQEDRRNAAEANLTYWQRLTNKEQKEVSTIIQEDIFDETTGYIKPNAMVNLIMVVVGEIWEGGNGESRGIGQKIMDALCCIAVILCGVLGAAQYFIGAIEFSLITAVGVILLPFMLWDGTKFITEKLVGALIGFFLKMLFLTICILFMYYGFLGMTLRSYNGALDQIVYFIFSAVFYMMITQNGPQLAVTLLTGTPQMSLMEAAQAAGIYGGAALLGKKAAGAAAGGVAKTAFAAGGTEQRARGASDFVKSEGGSRKEQGAAYRASVRSSAADAVKARVSNVGRSLVGSGGGGGGFFGGGKGGGGSGGGGGTGYNRFSQRERFNQRDERGRNPTLAEHHSAQYNMGQEDGLNYMIKQEERAKKANPPAQGRSLGEAPQSSSLGEAPQSASGGSNASGGSGGGGGDGTDTKGKEA